MNKLNKKKNIKKKEYFIPIIFFLIILTIYLLSKTKDNLTLGYLLVGLLVEILIIFVLALNLREYLDLFHNIYLFLIIFGVIFLRKLYLLFIVLILFIALITREIFDVCLFKPEVKRSINGTVTINILLIIIFLRIIFQKLYKNLLKF